MKKVLIVCLLFVTSNVFSQVVINEVSTNNYNLYPDNDGDYEDWIELYNSGASAVNLNGYKITDNPLVPNKWTIPSVSIPANGYLTLFASGKDRADYVNHYESLVLESNTWKYKVPTANIANWQSKTFDDAAWSQGPGGFGFADGDDATVVPTGTLAVYARRTFNVVNPTEIKYLSLFLDYDDAFVAYLNGVEIARNNFSNAVVNYNTPSDIDREANMYTGGNPEMFNIPQSKFASLLTAGNNVLSIEVHNVSTTSSDLSMRPFLIAGVSTPTVNYQALPSWFVVPTTTTYLHTNFKLKAGGQVVQLYNATGTLVNSVSAPALLIDNTYGRHTNGSATLRILTPATPNATNNTATPFVSYWNDPVSFSVPAGFYSSNQTVSITSTNVNSTIRYTLDGTKPTETSTVYSGPITITKNTILRAGTFNTGYLPSNFETNTYFINQSVSLPVFSISSKPASFFDENEGIYVNGPTAVTSTCPDMPHYCYNYWKEWEKEIHIEYFDKGKVFKFEQDAGIKILGGWSRTLAQKSVQIRAGEQYGKNSFDFPFYTEKKKTTVDKFETFTLRNGGNDFEGTLLRDAVNHRVLNSMSCIDNNIDFEAYQPVVVFINGVYWGIHTMRERIDDSYFENNFGYKDDEIDYCEFEGEVKEGSNTEFLDMVNYINTNDLTVTANYNTVKSMLDINNYIDYMCAEIYHTNWDWPHNNIKFWQPKAVGGKWRFIYHDTDFSWGLFNYSTSSTNELNRVLTDDRSVHSPMLAKLLTNSEFKNAFINRFSDLMNTIYSPAQLKAVMDELKSEIEPEITRHVTKWPGSVSGSLTSWNGNVTGVKNMMDARPSYVRTHIQSEFSLAGQTTVTINALPAGAGRVEISTVAPCGLPWTGVYYRGVPVKITAYPNPGYTFKDWTVSGVTLTSTTSASNTVTFGGATATLTANFNTTTQIPKLIVTEINYQSDTITSNNSNAGDWIEIFNAGNTTLNLSNWTIKDSKIYNAFKFPNGTNLAAGQYLVVANDLIKFAQVNPSVSNVIGPLGFNLSNDGETVKIIDPIGNERYSVTYNDASPWPFLSNGKGTTLELKSTNLNPNDPLSWMDGCRNGSPGKAYAPCPCSKPDLGPDAILCVTSGSKTLNSALTSETFRKFSWYVNNIKVVTASGPTYTTTVAGTYVVVADSLGCVQKDEITLTNDISFNLGSDKILCNPIQDTLRIALPPNGITFEWYLNSVKIPNENNQYLRVSATGNYEARVSAGTCTNKSDQIIIASTAAATPVDGSRCGAGTVNLSIANTISGKTYQWFDAATSGNYLTTGTTYTTPSISQSKIYYVADASYYGGSVGPVDSTFGNLSQWVDNYHTNNGGSEYRFRFNVLKNCTFNAVTVYAASAQTIVINIWASNGTTLLYSTNYAVPAKGVYRVPMNYAITTGTGYYLDAKGTTGNLYYNHDNATYPYTESGGYISITGTVPTWVATNGWYPYIYKWEFSNGVGPCQRIPVKATINCVVNTIVSNFVVYKQGKNAKLSWVGNNEDGLANYIVERSYDGTNFVALSTIEATGQATNNYSYTDVNVLDGAIYYRIVMVALDGTRKNSNTVALVSTDLVVEAYPNPFVQDVSLKVLSSTPFVDVVVFDVNGQKMGEFTNVDTSKPFLLGNQLAQGVYIIQIKSLDTFKAIKVYKN